MIKKVWKYNIPVNDSEHVIDMPYGARFVHAECQKSHVVSLWFEVDSEIAFKQARIFTIYGTGHPIPDTFEHIATVKDGMFMWHVYEE